jgi:hypothetical protein
MIRIRRVHASCCCSPPLSPSPSKGEEEEEEEEAGLNSSGESIQRRDVLVESILERGMRKRTVSAGMSAVATMCVFFIISLKSGYFSFIYMCVCVCVYDWVSE